MTPLAYNEGWIVNAAGLHVNRRFGFGLMDALALTKAAANWTTVPPWKHCTIPLKEITMGDLLSFSTAKCKQTVNFLEHVEFKASIEHPVRGQLEIFLTSPAGTRVQLLGRRPEDTSNLGFYNWSFMSVHTWAENPAGEWTVQIIDWAGGAVLRGCQLVLHGTKERPRHMAVMDTPGMRTTLKQEYALGNQIDDELPVGKEHSANSNWKDFWKTWLRRVMSKGYIKNN
ncbi:Hypothetical predicted protein [Cloeon dipterum]|uniref:P/Homo B domain-containing protein n=1 Tax=Cloeon dipterum TaxID=197152 RepID=A0A8S1E215_9INSE|nr:Hypothetical predicted protein [Cloeon dipterum]